MSELKYTDISETLRYMGCSGEPDAETLELAEKYSVMVEKNARYSFLYRLFDLSEIGHILIGDAIKHHLEGCEKVIVLAATLGFAIDDMIRRESVLSASGALAADAAAGACIEGFLREKDEELSKLFEGKNLTWRFSPGYSDMPLSVQSDIIRMLDAERKIGITLTDSYLMLPMKSVTALIGVTDAPIEKGRVSCASCHLKNDCSFRRKGELCGS